MPVTEERIDLDDTPGQVHRGSHGDGGRRLPLRCVYDGRGTCLRLTIAPTIKVATNTLSMKK